MLVKFHEQQGGQCGWGSVNQGKKGIEEVRWFMVGGSMSGMVIMQDIIGHTVTFTPCKIRKDNRGF